MARQRSRACQERFAVLSLPFCAAERHEGFPERYEKKQGITKAVDRVGADFLIHFRFFTRALVSSLSSSFATLALKTRPQNEAPRARFKRVRIFSDSIFSEVMFHLSH